VDAIAGAKFVGSGASKIGVNGDDARNAHSVAHCIQDLRCAAPWDGPSTGRVPLRGDGKWSDAGLDTGSVMQCGLLFSRLDVGKSGIGVVPTGPDERILH